MFRLVGNNSTIGIQGRLVSLTSDNVLHLWEINSDDFTSTMAERKTFDEFELDGGLGSDSIDRVFCRKLNAADTN